MSDRLSPRCQKTIVSSGRLAPRTRAGDDLAELGVQRLARQQPRVDVRAQRPERAPSTPGPSRRPRPCPRSSSSDSSTALIVPYGTTSAPGSIHSVRSSGSGCSSRDASTTMSAPRTHDSQSSVTTTGARTSLPQLLGERVAALGPARVHADLVELEEPVDQPHVPVGGAARSDVPEHLRVGPCEVARADRGDGAGAHVGQPRGVDDRARRARSSGRTGRAAPSPTAARACSCRGSRRRP